MEDDLKNGRPSFLEILTFWKTTSKMEDDLKMEDDIKNGRHPQKWKKISKMEDDLKTDKTSKMTPLNLHTFQK